MVILEEINVVKRKFRKGITRIGICYPSKYSVAHSSLSFQLLYNLINEFDNVICERIVFENENSCKSIESGLDLKDFDILIFTIHYELDYVNFVKMLESSGIPVFRRDRREFRSKYPLIVVGGPCIIANPEPIADFIDLAIIGEIEVTIPKLIEFWFGYGKEIEKYQHKSFYIPEIGKYEIKKLYVKNLDDTYYPIRQIIPIKCPNEYEPVFGKSFLLEIMRGCPHMCKFCMECYVSYPTRYRSFVKIKEIIEKGVEKDLIGKITLIGLSVTDHPYFKEIMNYLVNELNFEVSIPSIRADRVNDEILEILVQTGQKVFTIAPESSERIRYELNKKFTNDKLFDICSKAIEKGFEYVKLYFMIGLPNETIDDLNEIIQIVNKIKQICKKVYVSINPWIPKAQTPLETYPMLNLDELNKRLRYLNKKLNVRLTIYDPILAISQALLSLGDRDVSKIIYECSKIGNPLSKSIWKKILQMYYDYYKKYVFTEREIDRLPWKHINIKKP